MPKGISQVKILYTLASQAQILGTFKVGLYALRCLEDLTVPLVWQERLSLDSMLIKVSKL